jgi:hypothetical protein
VERHELREPPLELLIVRRELAHGVGKLAAEGVEPLALRDGLAPGTVSTRLGVPRARAHRVRLGNNLVNWPPVGPAGSEPRREPRRERMHLDMECRDSLECFKHGARPAAQGVHFGDQLVALGTERIARFLGEPLPGFGLGELRGAGVRQRRVGIRQRSLARRSILHGAAQLHAQILGLVLKTLFAVLNRFE